MNVLLTSVSRKVWLVDAFRTAVKPYGGRVVAIDIDPLAAALYAADAGVVSPRTDESGYEDFLVGLCEKQQIRILVPTRDAELLWFATRRERFQRLGVQIVVSSEKAVEICLDKKRFVEHCVEQGFAVPKPFFDQIPLGYPVFARRRIGSGGVSARRIDDAAGLARLVPAKDWIVQEFVQAPEFTIDYFADSSGRAISAVPRERLSVVNGESVVGVTVESPLLVAEACRLAMSLRLTGHNTLQCFIKDGTPLWIEINPRYGGGAALGFAAGAPSADWLLKGVAGEEIESRLGQYERALTMMRYGADYFVRREGLVKT